MFNAMSKVLSKNVMKKAVYGFEWVFVFKKEVFCSISKSNGQYFVHFRTRTTSLKSYSTFMKAASVAAKMFCNLYNLNTVASGSKLFDDGQLKVFVGADRKVYTTSNNSVLREVQDNYSNHIMKYYHNLYDNDYVQIAKVAGKIINVYVKYLDDEI